MILCFGTFASILNCCKQGLSQERFIPRVVWVVDRKNRCIMSNLDVALDADELDTMVAEGNGPLVRKLLVCDQKLKLRSKRHSIENASKSFKSEVMPYLDEDKIAKAVLAILYIISMDGTIATERKETFIKYIGMDRDELLKQEMFDVPDFFARVLLYTTCVDNKEGSSSIEEITLLAMNADNRGNCSYTEITEQAKDDKTGKKGKKVEKIEKIMSAFVEKIVNESWVELKWDTVTQTVELINVELQRFWVETHELSQPRLHLNEIEDVSYTDTSWLGIDERVLFPSKFIEFKNPETKRLMVDKLAQYRKLVHELMDCLVAE